MKIFSFLLLHSIISSTALFSSESLNTILAIVGKYSISQIDYEKGEEKYKRLVKYLPTANRKVPIKTQVMDHLIGRIIVDITAEEESIQVSEKRLESEIEKRMEVMGITKREIFEKNIQTQTGMTFEMWLSELPFQIKKGQLLQVRINTKVPSESEIKSWYNKNKAKVGFEVKFREIALVPSNNSIQEEARISKELSAIRSEVSKDKASFKLIASGPRNNSNLRASGGMIDWIPAYELFKISKITANIAAGLPDGGISEVFRDERKRYVIIKLEGKRPTPLDQVRKGIQNLLFRESEDVTFDKWILERRKEIPIIIYDKEYIKENKLQPPADSFEMKDQ